MRKIVVFLVCLLPSPALAQECQAEYTKAYTGLFYGYSDCTDVKVADYGYAYSRNHDAYAGSNSFAYSMKGRATAKDGYAFGPLGATVDNGYATSLDGDATGGRGSYAFSAGGSASVETSGYAYSTKGDATAGDSSYASAIEGTATAGSNGYASSKNGDAVAGLMGYAESENGNATSGNYGVSFVYPGHIAETGLAGVIFCMNANTGVAARFLSEEDGPVKPFQPYLCDMGPEGFPTLTAVER